MSRIPVIEYEDAPTESSAAKLKRKTLEEPFVPLGMLGFFGAVGYGAYAYKSRGQMSTSIYLMRLRVMAQSVVVGAITLGAAFTMFKNMNKEKK